MLTLIRNVRLYDPLPLGRRDILVCGERIAAVAPDLRVEAPDLEVLDAGGAVAVPGLLDQHVHIIGGGGENGLLSRIEPLPVDDKRINETFDRFLEDDYSLICFTSANGVSCFFDLLAGASMDARDLAGIDIAVIGPGTARALAEHGIKADYIPERFVAEGLLEELEDVDLQGRGILIARAEEARDLLPETLRDRNAALVDVMPLYRTVSEAPDNGAIEAAADADYVTFTSASTVKKLIEVMPGGMPSGAKLVSIGPITSDAAREAGLEVAIEAGRHDIDGLLDALLEDLA